MKSQLWWYTARSGGIVAWVLSAASVVWGLLLSSPKVARRVPRATLLDLHRFLGALAVVFTGVHVAGLLIDKNAQLGPVDVVVPFASGWRPGAVAWGVAAFYLLIAVELTSVLRRRVGDHIWRVAHYGGFGVFLFGAFHGLSAGTDVKNPLLWWPAAGLSAAIVGLCAARVFANGDPVPLTRDPVADRPATALLERTLEGLRQLDEVPPPAITAEPLTIPAQPDFGLAVPLLFEPPSGLSSRKAVSGSLFPTSREVFDETPSTDLTIPAAFDHGAALRRDERNDGWLDTSELSTVVPVALTPPPRPPAIAEEPAMRAPADLAAAPTSAPAPALVSTRELPVRTPRRLARTTEAAERLDAWQPARANGAVAVAPPAPPAAIDPSTGEPDPHAYRKWLREWLVYVESQG